MTYQERAAEALKMWRHDRPSVIAVDTETEGTAFYDPAFSGIVAWRRPAPTMDFIGEGPGPKNVQVTGQDGSTMVYPYSVYKAMREEPPVVSHYIEFGDEDWSSVLREIMLNTPSWVFHNSKFDLQKLLLKGVIGRHEVWPERIEDTEALAHLQVTERRKGLKYLGELLLNIPNDEEKELKAQMRKHKLKLEDGYHLLPRDVLIPYAVKDGELTIKLWEHLRPYVAAFRELEELYASEREITLCLLDMEARGVRIDPDYVAEQLKVYSSKYVKVERAISQVVGKPVGKDPKAGEFNPGSSDQIKAFFEERGFETKYTTKKGGPSYGKEFLAECDHPLADLLKEYRDVEKMKNTYFLAIHEEQRDNILHPNFRQHQTKTGRFSSGEAGKED